MYASDVKHSSASLEDKLARLYNLHGGKPLELSFRKPYLDLLQQFGNPHRNLPPIIHVAGTNGKGSIVATLRSILEEAGYRIHAYTSPHLCEFNERIRLAGKLIDDDFLESLIDEALLLNGRNEITFFEITTTMAFAAFSRVPADILLLEVGLGGRMDCTNVIDAPLVSIISAIGYDHMEFLGDSIEQIATEKGGIIKPHIPCVISAQNDQDVFRILSQIAQKNGAPLARHGAEWVTQNKGDVFNYVYNTVDMILPLPNLQGIHQLNNAGAALAALQIIKDQFPVSRGSIERGLQNIEWPGRLQNMTRRFEIDFGDWDIWLDGGHNEDAAHALNRQATQWNQEDGKKLHLILGMMSRKDPVRFIEILQNNLASVTFITIPDEPQAFLATDMEAQARQKFPHLPLQACSDLQEAIRHITRNNEPGRVLIAGSLYLAGHVLKTHADQP